MPLPHLQSEDTTISHLLWMLTFSTKMCIFSFFTPSFIRYDEVTSSRSRKLNTLKENTAKQIIKLLVLHEYENSSCAFKNFLNFA